MYSELALTDRLTKCAPEYVSLFHNDSTLFLRVHVHVRPSCLLLIFPFLTFHCLNSRVSLRGCLNGRECLVAMFTQLK